MEYGTKSEWPVPLKLKAMKNNTTALPSKKKSNVKEISDGVYINLDRKTNETTAFEKAIEESFKDLKNEEEKRPSSKKTEDAEKSKNNIL